MSHEVVDPLRITEDFYIEARPGRGRGCFAKRSLPGDALILTAETPLAHVIFRKYKKEVCAWCFAYDRGKIWSQSFGFAHPSSPKQEVKIAWFCTAHCLASWRDHHDDVVCQSLVALEVFSRDCSSDAKKEEVLAETFPTQILEISQVDKEWDSAGRVAEESRQARLSESQKKHHRKLLLQHTSMLKTNPGLDLEIVSYFIRGIITRYKSPDRWHAIYTLAPSFIAYQADPGGLSILQSHCLAFRLLQLILPKELLSFCDGDSSFRALVERDCTNAFGLTSDSGDEYLGYGVWVDASFFNHSCDPNVRKSTRGRSWLFETSRAVEADEELCISYLGSQEELKLSVAERREKLMRSWGFLCLCSRCIADSELGGAL